MKAAPGSWLPISMEMIKESHFIKNDEILQATCFDPPIMDEGISLYEVLKVISGVPLFIEEHLKRLVQSAVRTNHQLNSSPSEIHSRISLLIKTCQTETGNIKIVINYPDTAKNKEDFYAFFIPYHYPTPEDYLNGVATISYYAERNNPHAKVANPLLNARVQQEIKQHNAYEALLLDHNGNITEGSRSNIFMVQGNTIITAPLQSVLPGITRGFVLDVCRKLGLTVMEKNIKMDELIDMESLFLTGTSPNVLPIKKVDHLIFKSATHPIVQSIMQAYDNLVEGYINNYRQG